MWLRLYTGIVDDMKVDQLPDRDFKGWIKILCLAKEGDGRLPSVEEIAYRLRISQDEAKALTEVLVRRGLLDEVDNALMPHNWNGRQFQSDVSTERVKRFRNGQRNVSETANETPPEQSRDRDRAETEQRESRRARATTHTHCDEDYLEELQRKYPDLNVREIHGKMAEWCVRKHKTASRERLQDWCESEFKPLKTTSPAPKKQQPGNGSVGKATPLQLVPAEDTDAYMAEYVEELISRSDFVQLANERDAIVAAGGPKTEWQIRCVAWFDLHKDEPAAPEEVAQLKATIHNLANGSRVQKG